MVDEVELADLIDGLQAVHDLQAAKGWLLARGPVAVPALQRYLCEGAAEVIFEPRRAAVEVLAALRAPESLEALLAYLSRPRRIVDPVARLAEEAVENAAARAVGQWRTPRVLEVLLNCARRGARPGVVEALAGFECPEAVPYFLEALEDDLCERAAEQALRQLGRRAEWALLGAVRTPLPYAGVAPFARWAKSARGGREIPQGGPPPASDEARPRQGWGPGAPSPAERKRVARRSRAGSRASQSVPEERPASLRRRRAALSLLAELGPSAECWPWLRPLLNAGDPALAVAAARMAAVLGDRPDRITAANRLLAVLPSADWFLQGEIAGALERLGPAAAELIAREIAVRCQRPKAARAADTALRLLLSVQRKRFAALGDEAV